MARLRLLAALLLTFCASGAALSAVYEIGEDMDSEAWTITHCLLYLKPGSR